jgi:uncharacterized protein (DUF1778 family)
MPGNKNINIRVPQETLAQLKLAAKLREKTLTEFILLCSEHVAAKVIAENPEIGDTE